jgi:polyisoprenoid-binding protein YceI
MEFAHMNLRIALAASLALTSLPLHATTYTLEPNYTEGVIRWNHLGFSNPTAQFSQATGSLEFDQADPTKASVEVTIPLANLNSGVPDLDEDLRSSRFFETARFPNATFKSTKVEKGVGTDQLKVTGDFSLHGVTKSITLDVTVNKVGENELDHIPTVGFSATTTLKRSEFGLGKFVPIVSDEIDVRIVGQGAESKAYADWLKAEAAKKAAKEAAAKK